MIIMTIMPHLRCERIPDKGRCQMKGKMALTTLAAFILSMLLIIVCVLALFQLFEWYVGQLL